MLIPVVPGPGVKVRESYPPVQVPENSSSIPGVRDKWDHGWGTVTALLALCLLVDAAVVAVAWPWLS